jgi:hypothetical protein
MKASSTRTPLVAFWVEDFVGQHHQHLIVDFGDVSFADVGDAVDTRPLTIMSPTMFRRAKPIEVISGNTHISPTENRNREHKTIRLFPIRPNHSAVRHREQ